MFLYQTIIVLIASLSLVSFLPSPAPRFWIVRALALSLAPRSGLLSLLAALAAAWRSDVIFAIGGAITAAAHICVASAQWGQAHA